MRQSEFMVPFVAKEHLHTWHEHYDRGVMTDEIHALLVSNVLGRMTAQYATSATEAASLVERSNPGCVAIRNAIQKL